MTADKDIAAPEMYDPTMGSIVSRDSRRKCGYREQSRNTFGWSSSQTQRQFAIGVAADRIFAQPSTSRSRPMLLIWSGTDAGVQRYVRQAVCFLVFVRAEDE